MKKSEVAALLHILKNAYPHYYKDFKSKDAEQFIDLYHSMFCEFETSIVVMALKNYINDNEYPPTIAGIRKQINLLQGEQSPAELWTALEKAIGRSAYNYVNEYERLPDVVQKWLGEPITLHKLSQQDIATTQGVTRGQFLKSIEAIRAKDKAMASLPDNLKNDIKKLGDKMGV